MSAISLRVRKGRGTEFFCQLKKLGLGVCLGSMLRLYYSMVSFATRQILHWLDMFF